MSFEGKTAIVTGAAGGMGSQIAQDLMTAGVTVARIDREPCNASDERALDFQGDLRDESFVRDVATETFESTGRLDYLVNAAGVLWFGRDQSVPRYRSRGVGRGDVDQFEIDGAHRPPRDRVHAPVRWWRDGACVHHPVYTHPVYTTQCTTQCLRGDDKPQDAYQASKAGVLALSKSLAIQLAGDGIRSNVLLPGSTESPMQERWVREPSLKAATAAAIPLGRVGTPQDMSNATLFLLSDAAAYITGTELWSTGVTWPSRKMEALP